MKESILYKKMYPPEADQPSAGKLQCQTCNHFCVIENGKRGICGVRENQNGKLIVLNYGKIVAEHIDPVEKKPLYHFMPSTKTYSIACAGCNFKCLHCQNYEISCLGTRDKKQKIVGEKTTPQKIIKNAIENNCPSISYTYTEPTIFLEFALECMKLAHQNNLKNIWVSNGYMSDKTLDLILPYLDAINVDLKSFSEKFYQQVCGAHLRPVLDNLIKIKTRRFGGRAIHLEITTLIIPGYNDSEKELKQITEFIVTKLGTDTPWHVSRFFPTYKMQNVLPTTVEKIYQAAEIGKQKGIKHVYAGNI